MPNPDYLIMRKIPEEENLKDPKDGEVSREEENISISNESEHKINNQDKIAHQIKEFNQIEEDQNESFDSEQELMFRINNFRKAVSTKASPNTNLLEPKKRNKIFERFAVSPVMQPIKNAKLMESKKKIFIF